METFDIDTAIAARLAEIPEAEKERFAKYQEEQRAKLKTPDRDTFGAGMVRMASEALQGECDRDFEYERMAEGYALMGDFKTAHFLTTNPEKQAFYRKVLDAPDMECEHGNMFLYDEYPGLTLYMCPTCFALRKC